ncbi:ribonuclease R [Aliarcobacter butzleri]|uniref:RNB domain-containing ribonuclease n=1 Tax=Aliarcobacter butzleri TaxID=28197 RepID=UPI0021B1D698|nr:ribonuclease R family protein [Aliarcobacter butzleri]MCT7565909.1 ribonuclease R [Aliarcobacter butzleri]MCT7570165.1 ribonuclease R [Aliarcobacter butzleri]MCT7603690.1 ribonuclease R [Aliarcobacter butzleri]MCT7612347.1 ribonuclease R [Aliarcobacter butzleri]MCT7631909.1 ribonuclease R [Aliarcobacter butzleri]
MLKELFIKIQTNLKDYTKEELIEIEKFIKEEIVLRNANNEFELNSKYKIATLKIEKNFAILEDLVTPLKNIKIELDELNGAFDGDLVIAKRVFNPKSKIKAKIIKIISSKKAEILVYVKDRAFYTVKENIRIENKRALTFNENDVLVVDNKSFEVIKNVGNISDSKVDEFISLYLYKELYRLEKLDFEIDAKMDDKNQRVDLRELPFCTIDPNSAKDHDDAIYFDKDENILYVAIADVSYFVKEGSDLDKLAFKKSTSIYLPSRVLPMLPPILSEEMCSLKEGLDRYSFVFKLHLDLEKLSVKKAELFEAVINSHKNFSYGRIDRVIEGHLDLYSKLDKEIFDYLIPLYEITKKFRKKRLEKGYDFRTTENRLKLRNSELESIEVETSTASHQLIEECMLLANIEASKKVSNIAIFRVHEEPSFKAISKLVDDVNILGVNVKLQKDVHETITHIQKSAKTSMLSAEVDELIIQSQTQAKYSSKNLGHFGLGFSSYSHFTSPIRRYSDLVLHRILKTKQTPKNIDEICEHISLNERKVDQLVWDFEDRKYARWANKHIGEELKVKVVDIEKAKAICYEKIIGMKVVLENYKGQKLFSKMRVKIKSADLVTKVIVATIV